MSLKFLSIPQKNLTQSITSASSSFKLNNIKSWAKNSLGINTNLTASDFGTQAFGVFRNPTGTIIEVFEFDPATIASSSITILRRGLNFDGDLTTETTSYKLDWPAGTIVMLGTDAPQIFQYLKEYIDGIAIAGAPDASTTVKGLVEEATDAEITAGTDTGGTGARLFVPPSKLNTRIDTKISAQATSTSGVSTGPASSSTQTITHSLGRTPQIIRLNGVGQQRAGTGSPHSHGVYDTSGNRCVYMPGTGENTTPLSSTSFSVYLNDSDATATGVVGNITSTTFDIVWTTTGDANLTVFMWEAQ